jgi:hypothetical protein
MAIVRPYSLACTAHPPPTAASVATRAKVAAIPSSSGRPLLTKGWSALAKTKGSTGRMHGLMTVSTPPTYDRTNRIMRLPATIRRRAG